MDIRIRKTSVQVRDSYLVSKKDFGEVLDRVEKIAELKRTRKSLKYEWAAHNLAYKLGIKRDKTAHVDFDLEMGAIKKFLYGLLGRISLIFIK